MSVMLMSMMQGCGSRHTTVCPSYPKPSQKVLDDISTLYPKSPEVKWWMKENFKLSQKLKIGREDKNNGLFGLW